ncbi:MAG TPA: hypothetical protein ENH40_06505, partial [Nitrospirae bacterium]|nr:hypothetical protein [Nitrospirota bacterium]
MANKIIMDEDDIIGFRIGANVLKERSLKAIFDVAAREMRSLGMPAAGILAARQQFFIGADAFIQIMNVAEKEKDHGVFAKLMKEIEE